MIVTNNHVHSMTITSDRTQSHTITTHDHAHHMYDPYDLSPYIRYFQRLRGDPISHTCTELIRQSNS
jgi:hypothetical protein